VLSSRCSQPHTSEPTAHSHPQVGSGVSAEMPRPGGRQSNPLRAAAHRRESPVPHRIHFSTGWLATRAVGRNCGEEQNLDTWSRTHQRPNASAVPALSQNKSNRMAIWTGSMQRREAHWATNHARRMAAAVPVSCPVRVSQVKTAPTLTPRRP
jgi:hypothetical protein